MSSVTDHSQYWLCWNHCTECTGDSKKAPYRRLAGDREEKKEKLKRKKIKNKNK
jgi:hypothetical protein